MGERERINVLFCIASKISLPDESHAICTHETEAMVVFKILTAHALLFLCETLLLSLAALFFTIPPRPKP